MRCMPKFSVRISWHTVFETLTSSASRTVKRRFERMTSWTFATLSSVFDIDGRPERGSSSTEFQPFLKRFHHSYVWVLHMASSPNAIFNISNVSVRYFPIFTKNFTQIRCSWKTLIFLSQENRQTRQTCDHIKKQSTMSKQDRAMRFSRRSSSNSLLESSSTCCAPLGRRNGGLFWTFGNFPDSPCRLILLSLEFSLCEAPYIGSGILVLFWHFISHDFLVWITLNSFTWHIKPCASQCYLSLVPLANLLCPVAVRMCHSAPWQIFAIGISVRHISECDISWKDLSYVWFVCINWDVIVF